MTVLDFEKPILELEGKIEELRHLSNQGGMNIAQEISKLKAKADALTEKIYKNLSPWETVQVARHPERPHGMEYISTLIEDFTPLAGDRTFGEDAAIVGGIGRFRGTGVVVIAQEKGHDTESRLKHNFGMPRPEGYRKAQRLMEMADHFSLPLLTFVDTAGADPRVEAEERGQAQAIARSIQVGLSVKVPFISVIIGEGGSGGAIALAAADRVLMLSYTVYSVISPEGCASILWRSREKREEAASALQLTAPDLLRLGIVNSIILEPPGGAHRHRQTVLQAVGDSIEKNLKALSRFTPDELWAQRQGRYLNGPQVIVRDRKTKQ